MSSSEKNHNSEYVAAYEAWVSSLSPAEQRRLRELGVDRPMVQQSHGPTGLTMDVADSPIASTDKQPFEVMDPFDVSAPVLSDDETLDLLRRLIGELLAQDNARLSLECLALVTGLAYTGDSMRTIARRHSLTPAAVSKRCVELTLALNLPPSRAMKSVIARSKYQTARFKFLEEQ